MEMAMSFPSKPRRVCPEIGHALPIRERLAKALRTALAGSNSAAKQLARIADCTPKAAGRWLEAENDMQVKTLLTLCREYDEVWDEVKRMCGRAEEQSDAERLLDELTARLRDRRKNADTQPVP
jgi:hypothetical protein